MNWYDYIAYFFAGAILCNGIPHFIKGLTGEKFPSPFASPPGVGMSPALVNVTWGMINFAIAAILFGVGDFEFGMTKSVLLAGVGFALMAVALARHFEKVNRGGFNTV